MIIEAQPRTDGCMNVLQVLDVIRDLSHSQGFYSRLYETILDVAAGNIEYEGLLQWVLDHQN